MVKKANAAIIPNADGCFCKRLIQYIPFLLTKHKIGYISINLNGVIYI